MKFLGFLAILPSFVFASNSVHFSYDLDSYKSFFEQGAFDGERKFQYTCSYKYIERIKESGKLKENTSVSNGYTVEKSQDNGRTLIVEDFAKDGSLSDWRSFGNYKYEFIDDNTLRSTGKFTDVFFKDGEYVSETKTYEKVRKLIDGKKETISYKIDGEEKEDQWERTNTSFDPFGTKYVSVRVHKNPQERSSDYSEMISIIRTCLYEQVGINNYLEMYKTVVIGKWAEENEWADYQVLEFYDDGTYKFIKRDNVEEIGEFKVENGLIKIRSQNSEIFLSKFELSFSGFNKFSIIKKQGNVTSYLGNYSRQSTNQ